MRKITRPEKMSIVNMPMINKENGMPNLVPYSHRLSLKPAVSQFRLRSLDKNRHNKTEDCLNYIIGFGQMDKVSDYGSEDSRFESWRGRHFVSKAFNRERL